VKLRFAMLADAALAHTDGKLYVLGAGGDVVQAEGGFPWKPNSLALVFRIDFARKDIGRPKQLEVSVIDQDGRPVAEPAGAKLVPEARSEAPDLIPSVGVVLQTRGLTIPRPGDYSFVISVNGAELGRVFARIQARDAKAIKQPSGESGSKSPSPRRRAEVKPERKR
jgi:hypothetical protein